MKTSGTNLFFVLLSTLLVNCDNDNVATPNLLCDQGRPSR
jgi:hypothetical protein